MAISIIIDNDRILRSSTTSKFYTVSCIHIKKKIQVPELYRKLYETNRHEILQSLYLCMIFFSQYSFIILSEGLKIFAKKKKALHWYFLCSSKTSNIFPIIQGIHYIVIQIL